MKTYELPEVEYKIIEYKAPVVEVPKPKPVEIPIPKPVELPKPKPIELPKAKPVELPKPKPVELPEPKPVVKPSLKAQAINTLEIKPELKPVVSTVEFAPIMPQQPVREPEMIIQVNLPEKGPQQIEVYEEDEANNVARDFCIKHKIRDREKQYKLLNMLETRINDHRYPALPAQRPIAKPQPEPKPEVVQKQQRPPLDPKIREECYNIFNEVWYDFDEEKGHISQARYLQVMDFVRRYKKISKKESGPFSEAQLKKDWDYEINTMYEDEDKQYFDRISHFDVLYICHDNLLERKELQTQRFQRKMELNQARQEVQALRAQQNQEEKSPPKFG